MKKWIKAFRLRTLPLAFASIIMGAMLAYADDVGNGMVLSLSLLTTLFLQILSNLANDYGDFVKGTDNENRIGPERSMQSGQITAFQMKSAIIIVAVLAFISGLALIYVSLGDQFLIAITFLVLGVAAIFAALNYTMGKRAYGYSGFGDLFVYIFFGLVAVGGTYYLSSLQWNNYVLLPATTMGLFSTAVLNLNNMRDHLNDEASGKRTIVVKIGFRRAKLYHALLLKVAFLSYLSYVIFYNWEPILLLPLLSSPLFIRNGLFVLKCKDESTLDPELKKLALSSSLFSILFAISVLLS